MDGPCDLLCIDLSRAESIRLSRPNDRDMARAASEAKALADATRLLVAAALASGGELCVCDLAWIAERSDQLVSHHARALRAAGLVESRRDGKMVLYRLTARGRELLEAVLGEVAVTA